MKKIFALAFVFGFLFQAEAQTVTFSEHIAPIIYNNCTTCHRNGEVGPFPLTNYTEVAAWANMIQYVTEIGYMPPWKPNPEFQRYQKEKFLTAEEKQLISDWVNNGTPQGNPALEPELPVFPDGSQVGVPDLVVSYAESYVHPGTNQDIYRYFVIPTGLTEDKNIKSLEFRPGNSRIVHHALIWEDTTGQAAALDASTPEYGYSGNEGGGIDLNQTTLPGYVPGASPVVYSNGITQKLHAGSDLKLQLHYAPSPIEEIDSSSINIFFEEEQANRILLNYVMVPLPGVLTNGPFIIPANETKEFHGTFTVPFQASLFSIAPHSHLLGTHWRAFIVKPDGDTIPLIDIPEWDFNWQGDYQFRQLIVVPAGSVIHAYAGYDNTVNNPFNPNNPPQMISWGEGTGDEMFFLPITYLLYQPGDENIVFEEDEDPLAAFNEYKIKDKLYPVFPSPSADMTTVGFTLETPGKVTLRIFNLSGQLIRNTIDNRMYLPGYHTNKINLSDIESGTYLVEFTKDGVRQTEKLVVIH